MIFSHVLYQLSYLAVSRTLPPGDEKPALRIGGAGGATRAARVLLPRYARPAITGQESTSRPVRSAPAAGRVRVTRADGMDPPVRTIAGAGFEPATSGL
jgi:hypothetical protein